jgi:DNA-binding transcriptional MerR regulator
MSKSRRQKDDGPIADLTPAGVPLYMTIGEVAEQTGISESVLRIWEQRYRWPKPRRLSNGYRVYAITLLPLLRAIHDELARGRTIGDLLRDPRWSAAMEAGHLPDEDSVEKPRPEWNHLPLPQSSEARRLRSQLEEALERQDRGAIARIQAEAARLRANDREAAVTAVMRYWHDLTAEG